MKVTQFEDVNRLLDDLLVGMQHTLGNKLVGLYLYGSLVYGDFLHGVSDIDLLAVVSEDIDELALFMLEKMHFDLVQKYPAWADRIEVQYFAVDGLKHFKKKRRSMVVISPGEPIHKVDAGMEWLTNWYFVQDYGITLYGAVPADYIEPIEKHEFVEAVRQHAVDWIQHVDSTKDNRPYQGYAVLTMCRALYTVSTGEQVSKIKAAEFVKKKRPGSTKLIDDALRWRTGDLDLLIPLDVSFERVRQFVLVVNEWIRLVIEEGKGTLKP